MSAIVLTSYFSKKIHPNDPNDQHVLGRQADGRVSQNDFSYIKNWYLSIKELNLEARIFCDNLSDEFISLFTTDKIKFVKVETSDYSNNDWRFNCYLNFLKENVFDNVFLTDCSDVVVVKNPSDIINLYPDVDFFICKDSLKLNQFPYINVHRSANWENSMYFMLSEKTLDLINMGVIGANYNNIILFLETFWDTRVELGNPSFNSDMWIGQYVFRHLLGNKKLLLGDPFTSKFKAYEEFREDVFFIHK